MEFAFDRGAVLSGRILFPNGPPASEIELGLLQSSRFLGSLLTTRTDDAGRFEFKGIDPDQLVYMLPRVADYWIPFGTVEAGQREVDIELQPTVRRRIDGLQ